MIALFFVLFFGTMLVLGMPLFASTARVRL